MCDPQYSKPALKTNPDFKVKICTEISSLEPADIRGILQTDILLEILLAKLMQLF